MTFILVFMGSPERMRNPHLRARMSEALEALMPPTDNRTLLMTKSVGHHPISLPDFFSQYSVFFFSVHFLALKV